VAPVATLGQTAASRRTRQLLPTLRMAGSALSRQRSRERASRFHPTTSFGGVVSNVAKGAE
jgi:hypothetical protein